MPDFESTPRLPVDWVASPEEAEALGRLAGDGRLVVTLGHEAGDHEGWSIILPAGSASPDEDGIEIPADEDGNVELVRVADTKRETDPTTKLLVSRMRLDRQTVPASDVAASIRAGFAASAAVADDGDAEDVEPWAPDDDPDNFADLDGSEDDDADDDADEAEGDAEEEAVEPDDDGEAEAGEVPPEDGQVEPVGSDDPTEDEPQEPTDEREEPADESGEEPEADADSAIEAAAAEVAAEDSHTATPPAEDEPTGGQDANAAPAAPVYERDEFGLLPREAIREQILAWAQCAYEESCRRSPLSLMLPAVTRGNR
jgi:hypothetical protein